MSSATKALNINNQYTTLWLIGGYDCNTNFNPLTSASATNVDLRVLGGVEIYKRLCVNGNIMSSSFLIGNVCAKKMFVDDLYDKTGNGIMINSNVMLDPCHVLCVNTLRVDTITNKPDHNDVIIFPTGNILLCSENNGKVFVCNDLYVAGNINLNDQNISNVSVLTTDTLCVLGNIVGNSIKPKTGGAIDITGDVIISGTISAQNLTGNLISVWSGNATSMLDMNCLSINMQLSN